MIDSVILLLAAFLASGMTWWICNSNSQKSFQHLDDLLVGLRVQNRELLNRLTAGDIHAFSTMQYNTQDNYRNDDVQYPRSDEAEAKIMMEQFGGLEGIGDVIYSQEERDLMTDLGIRFNEDV